MEILGENLSFLFIFLGVLGRGVRPPPPLIIFTQIHWDLTLFLNKNLQEDSGESEGGPTLMVSPDTPEMGSVALQKIYIKRAVSKNSQHAQTGASVSTRLCSTR